MIEGWRARLTPLLLCGLPLSGCMVGPDYTPPTVDPPDAWHAALVDGLDADTAEPSAWWRAFDDPTLDELILLAEERNLRLRTAAYRIDLARAQFGFAAADLMPGIVANGQAQWQRRSDESNIASEILPDSEFVAAIDMSWEIDVWGRVRRSMESARAEIQESVEMWRDLLVTIRAEVAMSYVAVRTLQEELRMLEASIALRREALDVTQQKYDAGVVTDLQIAKALAALSSVESQVPPVQTDIAKAINRISVLIGESPGPLRDRLDQPGPLPAPPARIAVGIPADVIRQRPDIRAAERRIAVESAQIGANVANLYPQFTIGGSIGFESTSFNQWFNADNFVAGVGPSVVWPIFSGGKILSSIESADIETREAVLKYEQSVLLALEEVENVLIGYVNAISSREHLRIAAEAYEEVVGLSTERYEAGVEDLDRLIDAQRLMLEAQEAYVKADGQVTAQVVSLYKALGGDWQLSPGPTPEAEPVDLWHDATQGRFGLDLPLPESEP
ncbi:MAG: efflux transporter outer membrane subunit [Planctomycetota bacterium]